MNNDLQHKVNKVEQDNIKLNTKVQQLEDKLLEENLVFQGIPETLWETHNSTKEKIVLAISHIVSGENSVDRLNQARNIPIKDVSRLGRYFATRNRPVLVEFYHKTDVEFILFNRRELPKEVYVDKQYSDETEKERRKLRPILNCARKHDDYKGKCRMEGGNLVIKGRNYNTQNLHQLPVEINGYSATSKTDDVTLGVFWRIEPF